MARGLNNLGFTATALDMLRAVGVQELPIVPTVQKYQREKNRSAYIHVKVEADTEQQKSILKNFRATCTKAGLDLPPMDKEHLLEIVLPKARVVCAYRMPLELFQTSTIPQMLSNSKILEAYTRKPRSDAQHHRNKE